MEQTRVEDSKDKENDGPHDDEEDDESFPPADAEYLAILESNDNGGNDSDDEYFPEKGDWDAARKSKKRRRANSGAGRNSRSRRLTKVHNEHEDSTPLRFEDQALEQSGGSGLQGDDSNQSDLAPDVDENMARSEEYQEPGEGIGHEDSENGKDEAQQPEASPSYYQV